MAPRRIDAVIFDFNGTILDDEEMIGTVYADVFRDEGVAFSLAEYPAIAGLPDNAIFTQIFARDRRPLDAANLERLTKERVRRYMARLDPSLVHEGVRAFIGACADLVPVAIASGAYREEIWAALTMLELQHHFPVVVGIDDVAAGKPSPQGFLLALDLLNKYGAVEARIEPHRVLVIEDATAGLIAAKAAGMRTLAVQGPAYDPSVVRADHVAAKFDGILARDLILSPGSLEAV